MSIDLKQNIDGLAKPENSDVLIEVWGHPWNCDFLAGTCWGRWVSPALAQRRRSRSARAWAACAPRATDPTVWGTEEQRDCHALRARNDERGSTEHRAGSPSASSGSSTGSQKRKEWT